VPHFIAPYPKFQRGKILAQDLLVSFPCQEGFAGGSTTVNDATVFEAVSGNNFGPDPLATGGIAATGWGNAPFGYAKQGADNSHVTSWTVPMQYGTDFWSTAPCQFTCMAWCNTNSAALQSSGTRALLTRWFNAAGAHRQWIFYVSGGNSYGMSFSTNGTSAAVNPQGATAPQDGVWRHYVAVNTIDASFNVTTTFYLDAVLNNTPGPFALGANLTATTEAFVDLGCDKLGNDDFYGGQFADVRLYKRALTRDEVALIYAGLG